MQTDKETMLTIGCAGCLAYLLYFAFIIMLVFAIVFAAARALQYAGVM